MIGEHAPRAEAIQHDRAGILPGRLTIHKLADEPHPFPIRHLGPNNSLGEILLA
jgi:hypothetical protein